MTINLRTFKIAIGSGCLILALGLAINRLVIGAATAQQTSELPAENLVKEIDGYKSWTKVNPIPLLMPAQVARDCKIDLSDTGVWLGNPNNPHRNKYFTVYVNELGRAAMLNQKKPKFPEGSVIVKEKLPARNSQSPELLTVMIKQAKGFNSLSGDWEYMVIDGSGTKIEGRGNLENCQDCHIGNKKADYIFRTYLPEATRGNLK